MQYEKSSNKAHSFGFVTRDFLCAILDRIVNGMFRFFLSRNIEFFI